MAAGQNTPCDIEQETSASTRRFSGSTHVPRHSSIVSTDEDHTTLCLPLPEDVHTLTSSDISCGITPEGSIASYSESAALLNGCPPRLTTLDGKPGTLLVEENELQSCKQGGDPSQPLGLDVNPEDSDESIVVTKESLKAVAVQVFIPFLTAGFGTVAAGLVFNVVQAWPAFKHVSELFILVPALLGLKGNLEMTLAARLSTQANLGNMDTSTEQWSMTTGNMALIQCQATVVAFLASLFAVLMGFLTESRFEISNAFLLCASSIVTASVASLILGSLMVGVVILSRKCHINPDNIATPIAASLGDLTTLALLAGVSSLLYQRKESYWISALVVSVFLVFIPLWVFISHRNLYTREVLWAGWVPVICAMAISSVGGCILDAAVSKFSGMAVFQPVINGVGGNLVAIQSCKLSTFLAQRSKLGTHPSSDSQLCVDPCSVFCGKNSNSRTARLLMLMGLPGHIIFTYSIKLLSATVITPIFLACYLSAALFQVALLLYIARCMIYWMWSRRIDPDNAAIPYLTALGDLLGIALLTVCFLFLYAINDHSVSLSLATMSPSTTPFIQWENVTDVTSPLPSI